MSINRENYVELQRLQPHFRRLINYGWLMDQFPSHYHSAAIELQRINDLTDTSVQQQQRPGAVTVVQQTKAQAILARHLYVDSKAISLEHKWPQLQSLRMSAEHDLEGAKKNLWFVESNQKSHPNLAGAADNLKRAQDWVQRATLERKIVNDKLTYYSNSGKRLSKRQAPDEEAARVTVSLRDLISTMLHPSDGRRKLITNCALLHTQAELDKAEKAYLDAGRHLKEVDHIPIPIQLDTAEHPVRQQRQAAYNAWIAAKAAVILPRHLYVDSKAISVPQKLPVLQRLQKAAEYEVSVAQAKVTVTEPKVQQLPGQTWPSESLAKYRAELAAAQTELQIVNDKIARWSRPGATP